MHPDTKRRPPPSSGGEVFDADDARWRCCCGSCHVETGALVIGVLGIIGGNLLCVLLILGHLMKRAGLYLAFLILDLIRLVLVAIAILALLAAIIWAPALATPSKTTSTVDGGTMTVSSTGVSDADKARDADESVQAMRIVFTIYLVVLIIVEVISLWLWHVVYRAYQFVKAREEHERQFPLQHQPQSQAYYRA